MRETNVIFFVYNKKGHFAKRCPTRNSTDDRNDGNHQQGPQLRTMLPGIKGPTDAPENKEISELNARIMCTRKTMLK